MPTIYKEFDIDVTLDDFTDSDLLDELDRRGLGLEADGYNSSTELLTSIYQKRRTGRDYQQELDELIYQTIGRIV
jgi:hypothetical protein